MMTFCPLAIASLWIFERVLSVFEVVSHARDFGRKLLGFAHGNESGIQAISQRRTEDEAARFDANDQIHSGVRR